MSDVVSNSAASRTKGSVQGQGSICLFGAALDTGNLGVSALCYSVLYGLHRASPQTIVTVFDHTPGMRHDAFESEGETLRFRRCGAFHSRRYYRRENLWNMRISGWACGLGNPHVRTIRRAAAVLDLSGGDSFTDLYGPWRFRAVTLPKIIAIEQGVPLILLPQTYGPFKSPRARQLAQRIVRRAAAAWARDERSFSVLRDLLGNSFDPNRHRLGVDVAFALPAVPPGDLPDELVAWLRHRHYPVAGLNISGLLYNDPSKAVALGFQTDYRELALLIARRLLKETDCRLLLVPHVVTPAGHFESDLDACADVLRRLGGEADGRVIALPAYHHPSHVKWAIGQTDWFCGTRMHSTIASLSSGVPSAAIAYSPKTQGVFETCGEGASVFDPREGKADELVECVITSFLARRRTAERLATALPEVSAKARCQIADIMKRVTVGAMT